MLSCNSRLAFSQKTVSYRHRPKDTYSKERVKQIQNKNLYKLKLGLPVLCCHNHEYKAFS